MARVWASGCQGAKEDAGARAPVPGAAARCSSSWRSSNKPRVERQTLELAGKAQAPEVDRRRRLPVVRQGQVYLARLFTSVLGIALGSSRGREPRRRQPDACVLVLREPHDTGAQDSCGRNLCCTMKWPDSLRELGALPEAGARLASLKLRERTSASSSQGAEGLRAIHEGRGGFIGFHLACLVARFNDLRHHRFH